jgi:hypothetical protein
VTGGCGLEFQEEATAMRFFASWWERVPARQYGPTVLLVLGFGLGSGSLFGILEGLLRPVGSYWT